MTKEYTGDSYFPNFSHTPTQMLVDQELQYREDAAALRERARNCEWLADERLWEQNYRKHAKTLNPLIEKETELHRILNDPATKKTAKAKADRESDKLHKIIWGLLKFGQCAEAKEE